MGADELRRLQHALALRSARDITDAVINGSTSILTNSRRIEFGTDAAAVHALRSLGLTVDCPVCSFRPAGADARASDWVVVRDGSDDGAGVCWYCNGFGVREIR